MANNGTMLSFTSITPLVALASQHQTLCYIVMASFSVRMQSKQLKKSRNSIWAHSTVAGICVGLDYVHCTRVRSRPQRQQVKHTNNHLFPVTVSKVERSIFTIAYNDVLSIWTVTYLVCTITFQGGHNYSFASQIATDTLPSALVASVQHCQALLRVMQSFSTLSGCSTSLLFFYRVRAVYGKSKIITCVFGFLWVATFGMSFVCPFSNSSAVSPFTF